MPRRLVTLNGSPVRNSSVQQLLEAVAEGARAAGGEVDAFRCEDLVIKPCQACGPEPTTGYCIFHDDMDRVYAALENAHAVAVGSPIYFDTVSAPLKLVMDRCNCVTMLMYAPGGGTVMKPQWQRTRRGIFVTACSTKHTYELAERSVRGFMKWTGTRWEETIAWQHPDDDLGSVVRAPELLARARAVGKRLIESAPLTVEGSAT